MFFNPIPDQPDVAPDWLSPLASPLVDRHTGAVDRLLLVIIGVGLLIHIPIFTGPVIVDTAVQLEMLRSFATEGAFLVDGAYSSHFPPLLSLLMAPFVYTIGFNSIALHTFELVVFAVAIVVIYRIGNHFSPRVGRIAALLFILDPIYYVIMMGTLGGVVTAIFLLLSLYCIIRGVRDHYWMIPAGLFAALTYLTKASTGYLLLIAGVIGLCWRFYYDRWAVFHNRGYIIGGTIFVATAAAWSYRNYVRLGYPWTNIYTKRSIEHFFAHPSTSMPVFGIYLAVFLLWLALILLPVLLSRRVLHRAARTRIFTALKSNQAYSALVLFVLGTIVIGAMTGAALLAYEPWRYGGRVFAREHIRYIAMIDPVVFIIIGLILTRLRSARRDTPQSEDGSQNHGDEGEDQVIHRLGRGTKVRLGVVMVILTLFIPYGTGFLVYDQYNYDAIEHYFSSRGVDKVWSNATIELKYNLDGFELRSYDTIRDIPAAERNGAWVIDIAPRDRGFIRYGRFFAGRIRAPAAVKWLRASVVNGTQTGTQSDYLRLDWTASASNDTAFYRVYSIDAVDAVSVAAPERSTIELRQTANATFLGRAEVVAYEAPANAFSPGTEYVIGVTPVDRYGFENTTLESWSSIMPRPIA